MDRNEAEMWKCFKILDEDGSGKISCSELIHLFQRLGDDRESAEWNAKVLHICPIIQASIYVTFNYNIAWQTYYCTAVYI